MKQFIIENEEKQRILEMHKYATQKNYLNSISESEKSLITEVTTLTGDELKGLEKISLDSKRNGKFGFWFKKPTGKNQFSINPSNGQKSLTYLLIPPGSMPSAVLVGVSFNGCFYIQIKKGELPGAVSSMVILKRLVTVNVVNNTTKKLEPPKFNFLNFDNEAHGYENDGDTVLQIMACASFDNLMKFVDKLKSNGWKGAESTVPVAGITASIKLV